MKQIFLVFGFIIICSTFVYGQDNRLIYSKQVSNQAKKTNEILGKSDAFISVDFVEIDLKTILYHEQLILQFGENNILVKKERLEARSTNSFCFVGSDDKKGLPLFVWV
jgi:hypothetical protein